MFHINYFPAKNWLNKVNGQTIQSDAFAGFTNAAIVLPQGVAFATIAGLPPEYGLYTAMITAIIAALFGSFMIMIFLFWVRSFLFVEYLQRSLLA